MEKVVNRVLQAFKLWEDRKKEFDPVTRIGAGDEQTFNLLQLTHFRESSHRLRTNLRPDEKPFLLLLNNHIAKLERQLYPNRWFRLFSRAIDRWLTGPAFLKQEASRNAANMDALRSQLKSAGLHAINGKLDTHFFAEASRIILPLDCQLNAQKRLTIALAFERDAHYNFQLDTVTAKLYHQGELVKGHEFDIRHWPDLKAGQIRSLLEGHALKQAFTDASGMRNERWVELSGERLRYYDPADGLNVLQALQDLPAITRNPAEIADLLENGQLATAHWKHNGQIKIIHLRAEPAGHIIQLLDEKQRPTTAEKLNRSLEQQQCKVKVLKVPARKIRKGVQHVH